jgi:outer membrane protein assembly factor BamA
LTNIKIRKSNLLFALSIIFIATSCNPTKYVTEGESLLGKNHVIIRGNEKELPSSVSTTTLKPYIKQVPNKKIFGARFHLGLYNLSNLNKDKWPHSWLRKIGEEPVIFNKTSAKQSKTQLESYLFSKGYFNAMVDETIETVKKESDVYYTITPGKPYKIRNIKYEIGDTIINRLIMMDTINSLLDRGMVYDVDLITRERLRLERFVRNIGFYNFSSEDIFFKIDSALASHQVDVYYNVSQKTSLDDKGNVIYKPHKLYRVSDVFIYPDFDPKVAVKQGEEYTSAFDTTFYQGFHFISLPGRQYIKPGVIKQSMYVMPGSLYNVTNTEQSQSHLTALKNHRLVNISYVERDGDTGGNRGEGVLDCKVQLTPMIRQAYTIELEGTNSSGNLGGAINFIYQNKNLFHGAENFNLKLKGAYETLTEDVTGFKNSQEFGIETSLRLPNFLMPYPSKENFIRRHDPKTVLQLGYNYQKLPVYTRTIANLSVGYSWKGDKYTNHDVNPFFVDIINLPFIDSVFKAKVDTTSYLRDSYKDMMIVGGNYTYIFSNQNIQKAKDYWYVRLSFNAAGNMLALGYKAAGVKKTDTVSNSYQLFGQTFAQYVKGETEISYHRKLNEASSVVYRMLAGVGWPYGNSKAMPFAEQYFGGGSNDIRAWMVRTLGPGSYAAPDNSFNQTADIKLEANVEYRFKLFWILEGAVFADGGNIWTFRNDVDRPGAQFKFDKFLGDFAIGGGVGLRFDIKFVMLRADFGLKLRDPSISEGSKWIPLSRNYDLSKDMTIQIGIGYPF